MQSRKREGTPGNCQVSSPSGPVEGKGGSWRRADGGPAGPCANPDTPHPVALPSGAPSLQSWHEACFPKKVGAAA